MNTPNTTTITSATIVAFHIGKGGRFHNPGFLSFIGTERIGKFTNDLFCNFTNLHSFKARLGYDSSLDGQPCIQDLAANKDFDTLETLYGITEDMLGVEQYFDGNGNTVGLTCDEEFEGVGRIDVDGGYDTTYTCYLSDCSENEITAIQDSREGSKDEILGELVELGMVVI